MNNVLFLDLQSTGMRPPGAHPLEIAWAIGEGDVREHLVRLPEGEDVPRRVTEITGLTAHDLTEALALEEVLTRLKAELVDTVVIHYAQFEKPFLLNFFAGELPFRVLCTHQITKRLFPNLPSQNIRATAGYFGPPVIGLNRAGTFVRATRQIWRGLCEEFGRQGLNALDDVHSWLASTPRAKSTRYEYRLDKVKRLELPDAPGIYRMLGKNGEVLYVGKATSLKSRVNSYFRGKKGRDKFKLEMLAQVWDLRVTETPTPLEAALLESDEIKRHDPPYNVVLKNGRRHLVFYSRDFERVGMGQTADLPVGPFRNHNWIEPLRALAERRWTAIFWDLLPEDDVRQGFELFCDLQGLDAERLTSVRALLAIGARLHRRHVDEDEESSDESETEDPTVTIEDIAGKFERLLRRAGAESHRARKLTKLLNADVPLGERTLHFRDGRLEGEPAPHKEKPWVDLDVDTFDRMSILLSELNRRNV